MNNPLQIMQMYSQFRSNPMGMLSRRFCGRWRGALPVDESGGNHNTGFPKFGTVRTA